MTKGEKKNIDWESGRKDGRQRPTDEEMVVYRLEEFIGKKVQMQMIHSPALGDVPSSL